VPTSATRGPDGAYYVGTLAEGAGNGAARVWRVVPGHAPQVYIDGLTAVVDIAFGPDGSLYASEFVTDATDENSGGAVVRVRPGGRRTVLGEGSLFFPGGVAVDRHGNLYVANWSILPATGSPDAPPGARGQVVRLRTH
jgi:sugar lactone lactonase YvrE